MIFVAIYTFIRETVKVLLEMIFGAGSKVANYSGVITVLLIFVVILAVFQGFRACFSSCSDRREEKKIEKLNTNITVDKVETNVLVQEKEVISNEVNKANANFADAEHRDSSTRDSDFSSVRRKFCEQHPKTAAASADDLKECTQMLDQTLDELKALKGYAASLEKRTAIDDAIQKKQSETIDQQGKLIAIYEKKKGTTISFFFGLVKIKKN
jgi:hypothetical protein